MLFHCDAFLIMWSLSEAGNDPSTLAEKQLCLLQDIDRYADLRRECFDSIDNFGITPKSNDADCQNVFLKFLNLQIMFSPRLRGDELDWGSGLYNKTKPIHGQKTLDYKSQPYLSIKHILIRNLNGSARFNEYGPFSCFCSRRS